MSQGADSANLYHHTYKGLGSTGTHSTALPPNAVSTFKKQKKKFAEDNLDRLEEIGLRQIRKNLLFDEYYRMVEGDLAYTDYEEQPEILRHVSDLRGKADIPSYVRHFDLIGQITKYLQGKYNDTKSKFRIDFFNQDEISHNEFDRDFTNKIFDFTRKIFDVELELRLLKNGISLKKEFKSEEEQQQYQQLLEQQKNTYSTPPEIKSAMTTNWKPVAVKWAQGTLEKDRQRFYLDDMEREFFKDYFLTGRYFKHYHIGFDYYEPERWNPIETFFSEDYTIKYPQDAEYVGNIQDMSPSAIVNKYGHLMTEADIKLILNSFDYSGTGSNTDTPKSPKGILEDNMHSGSELIPHEDYYDRQSAVELQGALNMPLGEETFFDADGEEHTRPEWIPDYEFNNTGEYKLSRYLRRDIDTREDTIRVVQAYWRSWDRIGLMYRETESGITTLDWVTDELDQDFLKEFDIKKVRTKSLQEFITEYDNGDLEPNSIVWTYAPKVWKGIKLSGTNSILEKDLYLGVQPLDLQIKGGLSNIYDVKLPVTGIITDSEAKKIRPYQVEYNYQMNLMHSLTEKEIGIFWLFDISLLPSDFEGMGDAKETLINVVDMARDIGLVPIDFSKQNMRNRSGQQFNQNTPQDISFVPQIQQKMQMAAYYKSLALESIGVTDQDLKTPSEYSTAEGIKVGQQNSFSQIEGIFEKMDTARLKDMEIGLAVAQHSQVSDKDISIKYTSSDEEKGLISEVFKDENFKLRNFGLLPVADSKRKKELEQFKQYLYSSNTHPLMDMAEVVTSDSFVVAKQQLRELDEKRLEQEQAKRNHEKELVEMQSKAKAEEVKATREFELTKQEKEHKNDRAVAHISAAGKLQDDSSRKEGDIAALNKVATQYETDQQKLKQEDRKIDLKEEDQSVKNKLAFQQLRQKTEELRLKQEQNKLKEKAIKAKTFGDIINKN